MDRPSSYCHRRYQGMYVFRRIAFVRNCDDKDMKKAVRLANGPMKAAIDPVRTALSGRTIPGFRTHRFPPWASLSGGQ